MYPDLHPGSRQARIQAHDNIYGKRTDVAYTDASNYPNCQHKVSTVTTKGALITCALIKTSTWVALEPAITLALMNTKYPIIIAD